ncbi:hypothetical protein CR513_50101, partial [Mucuna pruriens]
MINLDELNNKKVTRLISKNDERWIWHKKFGHINLEHISKLYKKHMVKGLPLELLHLDLFGPTRTLSFEGKKYGFVIIDDYYKYTRVYFLRHKHESYEVIEIFCNQVQNEKDICISTIRSNHGKEFEMLNLRHFVKRMTFSTTSLYQDLLNKMKLAWEFDSKVDKGIFLGYSDISKAYRVFNLGTLLVEESIHVKFNDRLTYHIYGVELKENIVSFLLVR